MVAVAVKQDTRWLEQRRQGWYVVLYVPAALHGSLGKKLRKSLGTRDIRKAQRDRFAVLAELRTRIDGAAKATSDPTDAALAEALNLRAVLQEERERDEGHDDIVIEQIYERSRTVARNEAAGKAFVGVALGIATPLLLHVPAWLREGGQKGPFEARTKLGHERTLAELKEWIEKAELPATLEAVDRRAAGRFVTECLATSGRESKTLARIISSCRSYWTFLIRKGLISNEKNPWDGQAPFKGAHKGTAEDRERPFTDGELRRLLTGPADAELADLMRVAALTGMRIEEVYRLEVRDCADGWFNIRKAKTRAGIRRVPIHPDLTGIVTRRCKGKAATGYLFDEAGPHKEGRERSMAASKRFGHYRKRKGVEVDEVADGKRRSLVNFHSFRRWFITAAARADQPERIVQQVVGHKAQGMTMGVYFGGDLPARLQECVAAVRLPTGCTIEPA